MSLFNSENKKKIKQIEEKLEKIEKTLEHNERVFNQVLEGLSRELGLSIYAPKYYFSNDAVVVYKKPNKK